MAKQLNLEVGIGALLFIAGHLFMDLFILKTLLAFCLSMHILQCCNILIYCIRGIRTLSQIVKQPLLKSLFGVQIKSMACIHGDAGRMSSLISDD